MAEDLTGRFSAPAPLSPERLAFEIANEDGCCEDTELWAQRNKGFGGKSMLMNKTSSMNLIPTTAIHQTEPEQKLAATTALPDPGWNIETLWARRLLLYGPQHNVESPCPILWTSPELTAWPAEAGVQYFEFDPLHTL